MRRSRRRGGRGRGCACRGRRVVPPQVLRRPRQCDNNSAAANAVARQRQAWRRDGVGKRARRRDDPGRGGVGARKLLTRWHDNAERGSASASASPWQKRSRGGGERDDGDKRGDDAVAVDAAVDAAARSARRRRAQRRWRARQRRCETTPVLWPDGVSKRATTADVVARAGGICRRGGVTMPSVAATTWRLPLRRWRTHGTRQRQVWQRDDGSKRAGRLNDSGQGGVGGQQCGT